MSEPKSPKAGVLPQRVKVFYVPEEDVVDFAPADDGDFVRFSEMLKWSDDLKDALQKFERGIVDNIGPCGACAEAIFCGSISSAVSHIPGCPHGAVSPAVCIEAVEEFPAGSQARLLHVMRLIQVAIDDFFGDADCDYIITLHVDSNGVGCFVLQHDKCPFLYTDNLRDDFKVSIGNPDDAVADLLAHALNETRHKMNLPL